MSAAALFVLALAVVAVVLNGAVRVEFTFELLVVRIDDTASFSKRKNVLQNTSIFN
jgi:hypothetical protein